MGVAYLGLGSNLGDRLANLNAAIEALDWGEMTVTARSRVYETDPVDTPPGSPDFLNQVIQIETDLDARGIWKRSAAVEAALGRNREHEERWGPRIIDVDVLLVGDETLADPDLEVPHPRMTERGFVLIPLAELAPDLVIPGASAAVADLARARAGDGVRPA